MKEVQGKDFLNKKTEKLVLGFSVKQLVWFIIGILISINALIFLVLGLITDYASIPGNIISTPNQGMINALGGIDFKWFGVMTFVLGTLIYSLTLSFASKNEDREKEREARREQRLKAMEEQDKGIVLNYEESTINK